MTICEVRQLGLISYHTAWQLQKELAGQRARHEIPDTLLLLEHPHTYTLGRAGQIAHLVWEEAERDRRGVAVEWVDRGGDITYHGPGQLVGYPILKLGEAVSAEGYIPKGDYLGYLRKLEEVLIRTLAKFGIVSGQLQGLTGVWVQPAVARRCAQCPPSAKLSPSKIAALGIKVDAQGVSQHGFALNVAPEMSFFEGIVACGLRDYGVISLADLTAEPPGFNSVIIELVRQFGLVFEREMNWISETSGVRL